MRYARGGAYITLNKKPSWWHRVAMRAFGWKFQ